MGILWKSSVCLCHRECLIWGNGRTQKKSPWNQRIGDLESYTNGGGKCAIGTGRRNIASAIESPAYATHTGGGKGMRWIRMDLLQSVWHIKKALWPLFQSCLSASVSTVSTCQKKLSELRILRTEDLWQSYISETKQNKTLTPAENRHMHLIKPTGTTFALKILIKAGNRGPPEGKKNINKR